MDRSKSKREQGIVTPPRPEKSGRHMERKATNTPAFNTKVKKRRIKAKFAELSKRRNRGK